MTPEEIVAKFRHWVTVAPTDSYADGFLTLRWRDIEAAADVLEGQADQIERLDNDMRCLQAAIGRWARHQHASDWVAVIVNDDGELQVLCDDDPTYDDDWVIVTEDDAP